MLLGSGVTITKGFIKRTPFYHAIKRIKIAVLVQVHTLNTVSHLIYNDVMIVLMLIQIYLSGPWHYHATKCLRVLMYVTKLKWIKDTVLWYI